MQKFFKKILSKIENKIVTFVISAFMFCMVFMFSFLYNYFFAKSNQGNILQNRTDVSSGSVVQNDKSLENNLNKISEDAGFAKNNFEYFNRGVVDFIYDGDTVLVKGENFEEKVRMLAVNTLEKDSSDARERCLANRATDFTKTALSGKEVELYFDKTQPERDKYGRILAYVVLKDGVLADNAQTYTVFNETLMKSGLSKTYRAAPPATEYKNYEEIRKQAEIAKKGVWDDSVCK